MTRRIRSCCKMFEPFFPYFNKSFLAVMAFSLHSMKLENTPNLSPPSYQMLTQPYVRKLVGNISSLLILQVHFIKSLSFNALNTVPILNYICYFERLYQIIRPTASCTFWYNLARYELCKLKMISFSRSS